MKATGILSLFCILAAVGLAAGLVFERQAGQKLAAQNDALRRELDQMAGVTAENQRLSNLLARANPHATNLDGTISTNGMTDARLTELAGLRNEVAAFQQQSNELASLRADTQATHDAMKAARQAESARRVATRPDAPANNGAALEILEADYGTTRSNLDVAAALNDRVRGGSLKIIASNNMGGDPDFGQVKDLTVIYRFGGAVFTNQFREGSVVVLPPDQPSATP